MPTKDAYLFIQTCQISIVYLPYKKEYFTITTFYNCSIMLQSYRYIMCIQNRIGNKVLGAK